MRAYDFDGTITAGYHPGPEDIIITGRSYEECEVVRMYLTLNCIPQVAIFFNPIPVHLRGTDTDQSQVISAWHKVNTIKQLLRNGAHLTEFFEDNEIQYDIINSNTNIKVTKV